MHRLYLHIGLMKSGTTYLQQVWRANAEALAAQGIWTPAARGEPDTMLAVWDLAGRRPRGADDATISGRWRELVDAVAAHEGRDVLLSDEYFATRTRRQARRAVLDLAATHEVHVVVTVRDLGRVLTSSWAEDVKSGSTVTWQEYVAAVRDPEQITRNPARGFWLRQDLAHVLAVWSVAAGAERIHVVTVPPPGAGPTVLLERVGAVVGYDAAALTTPPRRANESLGAPGNEVVRRLNEMLGGRLNQRQYDWVVKYALDLHMRPTSTARTALLEEHLGWAQEEAARLVAAVRDGGYDVVGDLDDLVPRACAGRAPDEATESELLEAAMEALRAMSEAHARAWWLRRRPDAVAEAAPATRATSALRSVGFRLRRKGAELADRNDVASAAMGVYLTALRQRPAPRRPR
jgi:hypothetical protein